jgi:hypothetical protein
MTATAPVRSAAAATKNDRRLGTWPGEMPGSPEEGVEFIGIKICAFEWVD